MLFEALADGSSSAGLFVPAETLRHIQPAHSAYIERAARTSINAMTRRAHSPKAVDQLAALIGRKLPQPAYVTP